MWIGIGFASQYRITWIVGALTHIQVVSIPLLYNNAELVTMIKQIGLIAIVAVGLALLIPGTCSGKI